MESPPLSLTVGQQLRQARLARKVSLEQIAQATHIRIRFLEALENDDSSVLPSVVQSRGFLRSYAQYLKLDPEPLLAALEGESIPVPPPPSDKPPVVSSPLPSGESETIFAEIGALLRQQRELLGISLEDVERHTHLRLHNLQVLEQGRLQQLPSPVQARGMLSNYAGFLGLDPEPLMLRFAEGLQAGLAARQAARPTPERKSPAPPGALRRFFSIDLIVGITLVVFLVVFVSWSALRISSVRTSQTATATAPSIADVLSQPSATATADAQLTATPDPNTILQPGTPALQVEPSATAGLDETPEPASLPAATPTVFAFTSGTAVQVNVIARQRAWMRVLVDGEVGFEGRVLPGGVYVFAARDQIQVLTGNGAALQVFYNQQDLGTLGILGEVIDRIFTPDGMLTPTPSPTPFGERATPTIPAGLVFPTPGVP